VSEILTVDAVSKQFKIHRNRPATLKETIIRRLTGRYDNGSTSLWALQDVSFSMEQGRTLGIIGHNGAGKSTLLRLLCGVGKPTKGIIRCMGQVGSLLELGAGFHAEMTGRENLMTGGILSGLTKRQVIEKEDEIIGFAELEDFIDQPVRTYSTGMYLRLAFATAIHFDPDFLVIDEILAVGDFRFQQKCLEQLKNFHAAGKALILVSHDLDKVRALCEEVLVLEEGRAVVQADPESAISCYHDLMRRRTERRAEQLSGGVAPSSPVLEQGSRMGTQEATIGAVNMYDGQGSATDNIRSGESLTIEIEYCLTKPLSDMALILSIYNDVNVKCFEDEIVSTRATFGQLTQSGGFRCYLPKLPLLPGCYYIVVGLYPTDWSYVYDYHWQMHALQVRSEDDAPSSVSGVVSIAPAWSISG
jgi:lipopolysaccharide transport system ATP-binding protein